MASEEESLGVDLKTDPGVVEEQAVLRENSSHVWGEQQSLATALQLVANRYRA
jgi:hypothetical protein